MGRIAAVVGVNWGDEGKGRMVDLFAGEFDVVVRYQGGNNAGHTVVNDRGQFILNLLPSGILREDCVNVMGPGMVVDLEHLCGEIGRLRERGVKVTPDNLKISDRATICMPYHKLLDCLEEDRLGAGGFGSTRRGIAPVYADKYMKKAFRLGDLLDPGYIDERIDAIVEWKNITVRDGYRAPAVESEAMKKWLDEFGSPLKEFITDTTAYLSGAVKEGKSIMFEAQLGALRDIDFGIYPFTSSSSTIASYAPIGAGVPFVSLTETVGIMKAYSSCVGAGPFTCELFGEEGDALREAGGEYGAATGRPRRVGGFDVVASRYGAMMQGADSIALTKLDVLSYMDRIPVTVKYLIDGEECDFFPHGSRLNRAKPVTEYFDGWHSDISGCRKFDDLPENAKKYVRFIEDSVGVPIKYVSVGAARDQIIYM
ncbi:MAG: adenylosuccinate synthase [Clostridia bacterium]|nr:adenylosuccinate synthase [Clostridia bacterium]